MLVQLKALRLLLMSHPQHAQGWVANACPQQIYCSASLHELRLALYFYPAKNAIIEHQLKLVSLLDTSLSYALRYVPFNVPFFIQSYMLCCYPVLEYYSIVKSTVVSILFSETLSSIKT